MKQSRSHIGYSFPLLIIICLPEMIVFKNCGKRETEVSNSILYSKNILWIKNYIIQLLKLFYYILNEITEGRTFCKNEYTFFMANGEPSNGWVKSEVSSSLPIG